MHKVKPEDELGHVSEADTKAMIESLSPEQLAKAKTLVGRLTGGAVSNKTSTRLKVRRK